MKGIIMSGNHPKLIQDGIKTQTRRVITPQPIKKVNVWEYEVSTSKGISIPLCLGVDEKQLIECMLRRCPYGQVGGRLWVRETWWCPKRGLPVAYKANLEPHQADKRIWKPLIFMPRWASRITLEITEVRVERVQEITEEDIKAEGIVYQTDRGNNIFWYEVHGDYHGKTQAVTAKQSFEILWDSLNAKRGYGWEVNPWVWVISFKVVK